MRNYLVLVFFLFSVLLNAQDKYYTKTGYINFYSHAPMEDITADNNQVAAFLNTETGELSFAVLIKSFSFEKALMQEHFNENYMESDKFPKASFKGNIIAYNKNKLLSESPYNFKVKGELTIRGITKSIETDALLHKTKAKIKGETKFVLKPEEFDIKIPSLVRDNIAKEIEVTVKTDFIPYNR